MQQPTPGGVRVGGGQFELEGPLRKLRAWASLVAQMVKNPLIIQESWVRFLDQEDPLEKGHGNPLSVFLPGESH